jgi:hypothetical protein
MNKQDLLVTHMTHKFSICKLRERDAQGKIEAARRGLFLRHASASVTRRLLLGAASD